MRSLTAASARHLGVSVRRRREAPERGRAPGSGIHTRTLPAFPYYWRSVFPAASCSFRAQLSCGHGPTKGCSSHADTLGRIRVTDSRPAGACRRDCLRGVGDRVERRRAATVHGALPTMKQRSRHDTNRSGALDTATGEAHSATTQASCAKRWRLVHSCSARPRSCHFC